MKGLLGVVIFGLLIFYAGVEARGEPRELWVELWQDLDSARFIVQWTAAPAGDAPFSHYQVEIIPAPTVPPTVPEPAPIAADTSSLLTDTLAVAYPPAGSTLLLAARVRGVDVGGRLGESTTSPAPFITLSPQVVLPPGAPGAVAVDTIGSTSPPIPPPLDSPLGPLLPITDVPVDPPQLRAWQDKLEVEGDVRFANDASDPFSFSLQYDRALGWYTHWLRGGDDVWRDRAVEWADGYWNYIDPTYDPPPYNSSMHGIALHYLITGDPLYRTATLNVATFWRDLWGPNLGNITHTFMNGRVQSQTLLAANYAFQVGDPGWDVTAAGFVDQILSTQQANGAFFFAESCGGQQNFMIGLSLGALIHYHTLVAADPRIPAAIENSLNYTWDNEWVSSAQAFRYNSVDVCWGESGNQTPSVTLNAYFPLPFYWTYAQTGNTIWRDRGDEIMDGVVNGAWWGDPFPGNGAKQYNQQIMTVGQSFYWRQQ